MKYSLDSEFFCACKYAFVLIVGANDKFPALSYCFDNKEISEMAYHFNAKALHIIAVLIKFADNRHCSA